MNQADKRTNVTTAEVLAEVDRRRAERSTPSSDQRRKVILFLDRLVFLFAKHWAAIFNTLALIYVGLPILAPVLLHVGLETPGMLIYTIYKPLCHQLPQRSWFLFGEKWAYSIAELGAVLGEEFTADPWSGAFVGNETLGYKMAFCQRDVAIYGMILLAGVAYSLIDRWRKVSPLPLWAYLLIGILPMGVDGGYQLLSYALDLLFPQWPLPPYEATPLTRAITGSLFGLATVWLAYPHVQAATDEMCEKLHERFGWE